MSFRSGGLRFNAILERWMFVWLLSSMGIGYLLHFELAAGKFLVVWLFACMTFVSALGTRSRDLKYVAKHPWLLGVVLVLMHGLLPVVALGLGRALLPSHPAYIVGLVLAATIPVGVTSTMWTGLANGDMPLALATVSVDTLLSPILVPLTVHVLLRESVSIPFWDLFRGLAIMVVLPSVLGILVAELSKGGAKAAVAPVANPLSKLCMLAVVAINVAVVEPSLQSSGHDAWVLIALFAMAILGYIVGFGSGWALRLDDSHRIAMTYNVGMRNISAGIVIAGQFFGQQVSIPVVLAMLFQQPLATLVYGYYQRSRRNSQSEQAVSP